jgi:hypothetical protein
VNPEAEVRPSSSTAANWKAVTSSGLLLRRVRSRKSAHSPFDFDLETSAVREIPCLRGLTLGSRPSTPGSVPLKRWATETEVERDLTSSCTPAAVAVAAFEQEAHFELGEGMTACGCTAGSRGTRSSGSFSTLPLVAVVGCPWGTRCSPVAGFAGNSAQAWTWRSGSPSFVVDASDPDPAWPGSAAVAARGAPYRASAAETSPTVGQAWAQAAASGCVVACPGQVAEVSGPFGRGTTAGARPWAASAVAWRAAAAAAACALAWGRCSGAPGTFAETEAR